MSDNGCGFGSERCAAISRSIVSAGVVVIVALLVVVICLLLPGFRSWSSAARLQDERVRLASGFVAAGDAAFVERDFESAMAQYVLAATMNPDDPAALALVARARIGMFASNPAMLDKVDPQQARADVAMVMVNFPTDAASAKIVQAMLRFRESRVAEAYALLDEAAIADPASAQVHMAKAMLWPFDPEKADDVGAEWDAAVAAAPEDPAVLGLAGVYLVNSRETYEKGLEMLQRAVGKIRNVAWLKTVGAGLLQSGRAEDATRFINQAYSLAPRDPDVLSLIGQINLTAQEFEKAIPPLQEALSIRESRDVMFQLAMALNSVKRFDQALPLLAKLNQQAPDVMVAYEYANSLAGIGRRDEAAKLYNAILALPENRSEGMQAQVMQTLRENSRQALERLAGESSKPGR